MRLDFVAPPITTERLHAVLYRDPEVRRFTGGVSSLAELQATVDRYVAAHERDGYS